MKTLATIYRKSLIVWSILAAHWIPAQAQVGVSIDSPRLYFEIGPGQSHVEQLVVSNPSKDYTMEMGISFDDWAYSESGENLMYDAGKLPTSCAAWISVSEAYFSLTPGESKTLDIRMAMPATHRDGVPVHTAILYITQLNPRDGKDQNGANIRTAVRTGIKLYQRLPGTPHPDIEITNFYYKKSETPELVLAFDNTGTTWADGNLNIELLDQSTGTKIELPDRLFYTLPGDRRLQAISLPADLRPSRYIATAIINYGDADIVKIAELEFGHGES